MFGIGIPEFIIILILVVIPAAIVIGVIWLTKHRANKSFEKQCYVFCTKCGAKNDDNASKCVQCDTFLLHPQQVSVDTSASLTVQNYLAQAILVTIFCCVPFGVPAIVFAAQVNGKLAACDYTGAVETSKKAKMWCWISFLVGLGFVIIYFAVVIIGTISGSKHQSFYD